MSPTPKVSRETDLKRLCRMHTFSCLNSADLEALGAAASFESYVPHEPIFGEWTPSRTATVLISGIARITNLDAGGRRATVWLLGPGPIPDLPTVETNRFGFGCEALTNCRVCSLESKAFERLTGSTRESIYRRFHQGDLRLWLRLLCRTSTLFNLDLHRRVALTLLDLCDDFGIADARGVLLSVPLSHRDIASIVGASRPRVTEHLGQMERERLLLRQGKQFIVSALALSNSLVPSMHGADGAQRWPSDGPTEQKPGVSVPMPGVAQISRLVKAPESRRSAHRAQLPHP